MLTPTQHALRIAGWQLVGTFAMFAIASVVDALFGTDLPRAVSAVALMVGAQAYASSVELRVPGALASVLRRVALRAAGITFLVQCVLSALMLGVALQLDPEIGQVTAWMTANIWVIPLAVLVAFAVVYAFTHLGLKLGVKTAQRAAARGVKTPH